MLDDLRVNDLRRSNSSDTNSNDTDSNDVFQMLVSFWDCLAETFSEFGTVSGLFEYSDVFRLWTCETSKCLAIYQLDLQLVALNV